MRVFIQRGLLVLVVAHAAHAQWSSDLTVNNSICTASNQQSLPAIASEGAGGAIITWYDNRNGLASDIYAQRINLSGTIQWTADGAAICTAVETQSLPQIVSNGAGGAIITWDDLRNGTDNDIYAQKLNASGVVQWTSNGVAVSAATYEQSVPQIVSDGAGGAIIVWNDYRNGNNDIYASRLFSDGSLPVQLQSFSGRHLAGTLMVRLEWRTISEINNYGFRVQRRGQGEPNFTTIPNSFIPGHGTTLEPHDYTFIDSTVTAAGTYYYRLRQYDLDGIIHHLPEILVEVITTSVPEDVPMSFALEQNYPNPFNPATTIAFQIPQHTLPTHVSLKVFDVLGRDVRTLVNDVQDAGFKSVQFDAYGLPSGVYGYRLVVYNPADGAALFAATKKLMLIK